MKYKPKRNRSFFHCLVLSISGLTSLPETSIRQRYLSSEAEHICCILKFIHLKICCIRKRVEAQNIQSWLLGSCCAACRIPCLCVCEFVKLNPAIDAAHFNSTELVISTPRTTFLNFLLYAAGANNVIVCHRLALQTDCALMLHSFWLPSGSGTNGFLRHLL